jgi:hypothetical protein
LDDKIKIAKSWLQEFWKQSEAMGVEGLIWQSERGQTGSFGWFAVFQVMEKVLL